MTQVEKLFQQIDEQESVEFLQSLIQINSVNPPGNEGEVAEAIQSFLQSSNLEFDVDDLGDNRGNLFVTYGSADENGRHLVYSGHFDTVPIGQVEWEHDPFSGKIIDHKVFGRGTTDMKSGVAAMVLALKYLKQAGVELNGELQFIGTAGEEVDGYGAKQVVKKGQVDRATAMVVAEPSENQIFTAHKGCLWLEITTYGKTAHGSMPEQGVNAITTLTAFLSELNQYEFDYEEHPRLGYPTLNVGTIEGGVKTNVVPDKCSVTLDIRTIPGQNNDKILEDIENKIKKITEGSKATYEVKTINNMAPVATNESDDFIQLAIETGDKHVGQHLVPGGVNYYTDASVYWPYLQIPTLIYGPGNQRLAHQPNETVEIEKFLHSIRYYMALAMDYLGEKES